jgi:DNA invertase Pin-like site-specific DNA recombinase
VGKGVRVVVITHQFDVSGALARLVASARFGLAELEQEYRREQQAVGIALAKRQGPYCGRVQGTTKAHDPYLAAGGQVYAVHR